MITTVVLHGRLKKFGHRREVIASTPARAVHALTCLQPDFAAVLRQGEYRVLRRAPKSNDAWALDEAGLHLKLPVGGELHLVPAGRGSASGKSTGKAILGAVIVVAAVAAAVPTGGQSLWAAGTLGGLTTVGSAVIFGATMFLGGVAGLLSPQATSATTSDAAADASSTALGGAQNVSLQGVPVPLIYGRSMAGSVVASIGYSAEDYASTAANTAADNIGTAPSDDIIQLDGGTGSGGGGKSGGSTSTTARETPNTLRSKAVVRIIDVISEGPVSGLVGGAKGIFFNGTPLQAADGTYNFQGVTAVERTGQPDQDPVPGFPAAEQSIGLSGVQIKESSPHTEYLNEATATAARVTIGIPALYSTDTTNGNLNPGPDLRVIVDVQAQRAGAPWVQVVSDLFTGQKCTSRYQRSYRFDLPEHGQAGVTSWAVRVSRGGTDSTTASVASDLYWDAVDIITDHQLMYPNTHYIALAFDSEAFGTTVPSRAYLTDGMQVRVPANFDQDARVYATDGAGTAQGTWDGVSWKLATTNDPAWCLLDLLTEQRYGVGLPDSALETAIYDLFTVSQYAGGVIPDGFGGLEHRYSLNIQITDADDAYAMLQQFVSVFRGMSYWAAGSMAISADMPLTPSKLVVPGNVVDGLFRYEGTSLKTRHNVARVTWNDPGQSYRQAIEVIEDYDAIASQGQREVDIRGFGITSRGLARRLGRWLLDSEKHQTQTITYSSALDHLDLRPGEVFQVSDPNYAGVRLGGRLRTSTATVLQLDAILDVNGAEVHSITVTLPDSTVQTRAIVHYEVSPDGSYHVVTLDSPLPVTPAANAVYLITSASLDAPQFKVVRIVETERGIFQVTGLEHDPGKFDRVEYDLPFRPHTYSLLPALLAQPIPPPCNPTARDYLAGVGTTTIVRVTVAWTAAVSPMVRGTQVRASGPEQRLVNADGATVDIDGLPAGTYIFSVRHTGENGRVSAWVETDPILVDGQSDPPPAITGLTAVGGTRRVSLRWNTSSIRDLLHYEVWRNNVPSLASAARLTYVDATTYADSDQDVLQPDTTWYYWVRAVSTTLTVGAWSNMAQATTSYLLTDDLEQAIRDTAKYAQGLLNSIGQPTAVVSLPASGIDKQIVLNEQDGKLYQWSSATGTWVLYVPTVGATIGNLTADQIASINAAVIQGQISSDQIASLVAAKIAGTLTDAQIASLNANKLVGQLTSEQIADLDANKLIGTLNSALIPASSITSDQIAGLQAAKLTSQITSTQITDGAISTPKLAAGAVVANTIAAGAITAGKLTLTDSSNMILNGDFQDGDVGGWQTNGNISVSGAQDAGGQWRFYSTARVALISNPISVTPGDVIYACCMVYNTDPAAYANLAGYWTDSSGGNSVFFLVAQTGLKNQWVKLEGQVTAPPNANRFIILAYTDVDSVSTGTFWGKFQARRAASASLIVDGSITATKVVAGSITGDRLTAGSVNADRLVANSITAGQIAALTITGTQIAAGSVNANRLVANSITAGQIAAQTITGEQIGAQTILAGNIAAGQITTEKLAVANSSNVIGNSCFEQGVDGWGCNHPGGAFGRAGDFHPEWSLVGSGTGVMSCGPAQPSCYMDWSPTAGVTGVPMPGNQRVQAAVLVQCSSGDAELQVICLDGAGVQVSVFSSGRPGVAWNNNGSFDTSYTRLTAIGTTHGATGTVLLRIIGWGQNTALVTKTMLGAAPVNATQVGEWSPGGITSILGGWIKANTIDASKIVAGSITAGQIAAGAITAGKLNAGAVTAGTVAANAITAGTIATNAVTAGTIQAGAVAADQIAANQIFGRHMAAEEIISLSAQIGYAVINTAHIGYAQIKTANIDDLTVNGQKIGVNAVTEVSSAITAGNGVDGPLVLTVGVTVQNSSNNTVCVQWRSVTPALRTPSPFTIGPDS